MAGGSGPTDLDGNTSMFANMASFSVKVIEAGNPLEVLDYELCPNTGGAGRFRGGMPQRKTWRMLADEGILQVPADRQTRPYGLSVAVPVPRGATYWTPDYRGELHAKLNDVARRAGIPPERPEWWRRSLTRDLSLVAKDLRDGLVTIEGARATMVWSRREIHPRSTQQ